MLNTINISVCLDDNYFKPAYLLINSILQTNIATPFDFYIIFDYLSEEHKLLFTHLSNDSIHFFFHKVNESDFKDCPIRDGDHVSLATYYRLLLPAFLPKNVQKVLYLDGDMLCFSSLRGLYDINIKDYSLAASYDSQCFNSERKRLIDLNNESPYFAAGVLLVNLDYWRQNNIQKKTMDYIKDNAEKLLWHDQDVLNAVLEGTIKQLDFRYNFYETYFKGPEKSSMSNKLWQEVVLAKKNICLLHFSQSEKPWHIECYHPLKQIWRDYYKAVFKHKPKLRFKYNGKTRLSFLKRKLLSIIFRFPMNASYEPVSTELKQNLKKSLGV